MDERPPMICNFKNNPKHSTIKVKSLHADAKLPVCAKINDAGADLIAVENIPITAHNQELVHTGISIEFPPAPEGWKWEAQVRPRSGIALKYRITITNTPGTIDANYRGEIGVILSNESDTTYLITKGDKIAQLVAVLIPDVKYEWAESLLETDRGEGGFGHTGK